LVQVIDALSSASQWDACLTALTEIPNADLIAETLAAALESLLDGGRVATVRQWIDLAASNECAASSVFLARAELALRSGRGDEAHVLGEQAASMAVDTELA